MSKTATPNRRWSRPAQRLSQGWVTLSLAVLATQPVRALSAAPHTDYVALATGGRLAGDRCLYCISSQRATEAQLIGSAPPDGVALFANPALAAYALHPIAQRSLHVGLVVFICLSLCALGGATYVAWRYVAAGGNRQAALVALAAMTLVPGTGTLAFGNWNALLTLPAMGALQATEARRPFAAGLLMSVLFIKPQVVWLVLPALLIGRHGRAAGGLACGALLWAVSTVALVGIDGTRAYMQVLGSQADQAAKTAGAPGLAAMTGIGNVLLTSIAGATMAVGLLWWKRRVLRANPAVAMSAGITASLIFAPHVFAGDLLLLGVALVVIGRRLPGIAMVLGAAIGLLGLADMLVFADRLRGGWLVATVPVLMYLLVVGWPSGTGADTPNIPNVAKKYGSP